MTAGKSIDAVSSAAAWTIDMGKGINRTGKYISAESVMIEFNEPKSEGNKNNWQQSNDDIFFSLIIHNFTTLFVAAIP